MASPDSVSRKASRVEQDVENEGTEGRSSRGKKGKNGAKKLPQRGLGVAQLEKLRLQEQKLQESACFAATHGLHVPSFPASVALAEKGLLYSSSYSCLDGKFEICNEKKGTNLLSFCKVLPNPHQTTTMPVSTAFMSSQDRGSSNSIIHATYKDKALIYADLMSASTLNQPSGSSLSVMLPGHAEGHEPAQSSFSRAVDTSSLDSCLSSSVSVREQSNGKSTFFQKESGNVGATDADVAKVLALSTLDTLSVSSKSAISKGFLDRGLSSQRLSFHFQSAAMIDKNSEQSQGVQDPFSSLLSAGENSKGLGYNGFLKGSALCNAEKNGGRSLSNLRLLNSSFEPPDKNYSAVNQLHLPVMGISSFGDMPKELSSFQNISTSQGWTSAGKSSERKRPWLATQHPASLEIKFNDLGSNGLREINGHLNHQILKSQHSDCEASHLTSTVFLHDLGDSAIPYLKINSCISAPICQDSRISSFTSGFCPDPLLFIDFKRNVGSKNGYPARNPTTETSPQTISDNFLSLGPSSTSAYDFGLHNLGGSESSSLRHDRRGLEEMTSQQDSVDERKSNIPFTNEQTDLLLPKHPFIRSDVKGKPPGIMASGKSEEFRLGEHVRQPGASDQLQFLDLSLKLAL
ncbi:hypothetical protein O6H91_07G124600 [Diphasiastrum complanatum]|uniref:Uncharacterized protein n=3 Tax=Diphasiastrum complanatum TaxID=34168 RepID=A0ACC2D9N2_DIPCM|nr:hypothetical protein O6H91_07G124600 [Diphasiastrum complanatum]KAJ7550911.1 hypothetical protein O6H91_07G124600 [Diphasiastrum complanatum]KAJ7550912.1 hypothetical protein O6H91_07G124600 [Diphasiastrum complanatum]